MESKMKGLSVFPAAFLIVASMAGSGVVALPHALLSSGKQHFPFHPPLKYLCTYQCFSVRLEFIKLYIFELVLNTKLIMSMNIATYYFFKKQKLKG